MRQEFATTVKATDPEGHFEAVGNPGTGAALVEISNGGSTQTLVSGVGVAARAVLDV